MASIQYRTGGPSGYDSADGVAPPAPASRLVQYAGAATSVALILGVVVWGYRLAVRDVTGVPVIRALQGPARIAPEDPGGDLARHVGLSVNAVAGTGVAAPGPDQVILAPDVTGLSEEDTPMAALKPLPRLATGGGAEAANTTGETTAEMTPTPAALPMPNLPVANLTADAARSAGALPTDAEAAALDAAPPATDQAATDQAATDPADPAATETASNAAPIIPASVPGVVRSPRPQARPGADLVAEAAARAVAVSLGGEAPAVIELDPAALPEGTRLVQLGAFDTPDLARAEWDRVATRFEAMMDDKKRVVQEAASGGRTFYRLRVQGFADVDEARRFCAALVAEGTNCIPALVR